MCSLDCFLEPHQTTNKASNNKPQTLDELVSTRDIDLARQGESFYIGRVCLLVPGDDIFVGCFFSLGSTRRRGEDVELIPSYSQWK